MSALDQQERDALRPSDHNGPLVPTSNQDEDVSAIGALGNVAAICGAKGLHVEAAIIRSAVDEIRRHRTQAEPSAGGSISLAAALSKGAAAMQKRIIQTIRETPVSGTTERPDTFSEGVDAAEWAFTKAIGALDPAAMEAFAVDGTVADAGRLALEVALADAAAARAARAHLMPDERAAIQMMQTVWNRLKDLGWRDIVYCPKDGSPFDSIIAGVTAVHRCRYQGTWPTGSWWVEDAGDLWPARPILFRLIEHRESGSDEHG